MNMTEQIELDQGVDHKGRTFGYDHKRHNFITWAIQDGKIIVLSIENDDQEEKHGSINATMRVAKRIARYETKKQNSQLRAAILRGFQRD